MGLEQRRKDLGPALLTQRGPELRAEACEQTHHVLGRACGGRACGSVVRRFDVHDLSSPSGIIG